MPKNHQLRVVWIPQIGVREFFNVDVESLEQAKFLLGTLAKYDLYQLEVNVRGDFSNAGFLRVYHQEFLGDEDEGLSEDGWLDWSDEWGEDIDSLSDDQIKSMDKNLNGEYAKWLLD